MDGRAYLGMGYLVRPGLGLPYVPPTDLHLRPELPAPVNLGHGGHRGHHHRHRHSQLLTMPRTGQRVIASARADHPQLLGLDSGVLLSGGQHLQNSVAGSPLFEAARVHLVLLLEIDLHARQVAQPL